MPQPLDSELVARALRHDERAFRALIERHHGVAFAAVRAVLGNRDEVDDVMQMTYLKAYQGLASFRGDSAFSTWLYRIARHAALDIVSRKSVETTDIDNVEIAASAHHAPDRGVSENSEREWIDSALGELDDTYRTAIELRYMAEKSYEEIAEIMEIPVGTVKTYVHRGKMEMKRILSRPSWRSGTASENRS